MPAAAARGPACRIARHDVALRSAAKACGEMRRVASGGKGA